MLSNSGFWTINAIPETTPGRSRLAGFLDKSPLAGQCPNPLAVLRNHKNSSSTVSPMPGDPECSLNSGKFNRQ